MVDEKRSFVKTIEENNGFCFISGNHNSANMCALAYDLILRIEDGFNEKIPYEKVNKEHAKIILSELRELFNLKSDHNVSEIFGLVSDNFIVLSQKKSELAEVFWKNDIINFFNCITPHGYSFGSYDNESFFPKIGWYKTK